MKKPYLICSLALILSLVTNEFLSSQENNRLELEELYNDWRQFEFPPLKNGAPDYSNETFKNRMPEFRKKLPCRNPLRRNPRSRRARPGPSVD